LPAGWQVAASRQEKIAAEGTEEAEAIRQKRPQFMPGAVQSSALSALCCLCG
jgi:hypothetical protein